MAASIDDVLGFLERLKQVTGQVLPLPPVPKIISFMGTTSAPATTLDVVSREIVSVERAAGIPNGVRVQMRGELARKLGVGERITLSIPNLPEYKGYQVKTANVLRREDTAHIVESNGAGQTILYGRNVYTIHHGPNVYTSFADVDIDTMLADLRGVRYLLLGMGVEANISPRFIFHYEVVEGKLVFFHGDGTMNKTFRNIEHNHDERRTIVDPNTFEGYTFRGRLLPVKPDVDRAAFQKISAGFNALGWDDPAIAYAFVATDWMPIAP